MVVATEEGGGAGRAGGGPPAEGSGMAPSARAEAPALVTRNWIAHFGQRILSPAAGSRESSTLYFDWQEGQERFKAILEGAQGLGLWVRPPSHRSGA